MPKGTSYIQPAQSQDWETPQDLFNSLWNEFGGFDMDPCCTPEQYTAIQVFSRGGTICVPDGFNAREVGGSRILVDGLTQPWHGKVFMNPPYGLALRKWVPKAVEEVRSGRVKLVVALLPSKTDTIWWQQYVLTSVRRYDDADYPAVVTGQANDVRFLKGRLTFGGAPDPAGFASAIVVWEC